MRWPWQRDGGHHRPEPLAFAQRRPRRVVARDRVADQGAAELEELTRRYTRGELGWEEWLQRFWEVVARTHTAQWLLAQGGTPRMDEPEIARLEQLLERQLVYLRRLADEAAGGTVSAEELIARGQLYAATSVATYERALADTTGIDLPVYPADFGTPCRANCRCHWQITELPDRWEAYWITQDDERVCAGCAARANQYAPYVQYK
jgi:hypothetical protein